MSDRGVTKYNLIIQLNDTKKNKIITDIELFKFLEINCTFYSFILHDKDIIKETGELKTPHYHIIMNLEIRKRKETLINDISKMLKISKEIITVSPLLNRNGAIRYLIHYDDIEKHQYKREEIKTNNIDIVNNAIDLNCKELTIEELINVVKEEKTTLNIMRKIGLDFYKKYRQVIEDIKRELTITRGFED